MTKVARVFIPPDRKFVYIVSVWDDGYHKAQWIITECRVSDDGKTASPTDLTLNFSKQPLAEDWPTIFQWFEGKRAKRVSPILPW